MSHYLQRQGRRDQEDSPPHSIRPSSSPLTPTLTSSGCDVIKKGSLYVKRFPTKRALMIKTWQKKYLVLRDDLTNYGSSTLDIYDRESDSSTPDDTNRSPLFFLFSSRPFTIDLRSVVNVDLYLESRTFFHALIVHRSDGSPVILGAQSDLEIKCWLAAITLLADKANRLVPRIQRPPSCPSSLANDVKKPLKGSLSLKSKLNRSTPQLLMLARGKPTRHLSIDQELSSSTNLSKPFSRSYFDVMGDEYAPTSGRRTPVSSTPRTPVSSSTPRTPVSSSTPRTPVSSSTPRTPVLSDYHHSTKNTNSKSLISNFAHHKEAGSKWLSFSKINRYDSGFSETFDDGGEPFPSGYCPHQDTVEEEDDQGNHGHHSSHPPPIPPRHHTSSPVSPSPITPFSHGPWFAAGPPRAPPRPKHTLSMD